MAWMPPELLLGLPSLDHLLLELPLLIHLLLELPLLNHLLLELPLLRHLLLELPLLIQLLGLELLEDELVVVRACLIPACCLRRHWGPCGYCLSRCSPCCFCDLLERCCVGQQRNAL